MGTEFLAWRERAALTQEKAAERLGVTRTTIQNWEGGQTGIPAVVETACKVWERRLRQENPALGPVTLIYTDRPMWVDPYGPRAPMAMMQQESQPNNATALGRVLDLWDRPDFTSPFIMTEGHDILWNAVELRRVADGQDAGAPTPRRWRSNAIKGIAEYLRKVGLKFPVRRGPSMLTPEASADWIQQSEALIDELDLLASEAMDQDVARSEVASVVDALRELNLFPTNALASDLAQAYAWSPPHS